MPRTNYTPKPLFIERMKQLLPDEKDYQAYIDILKIQPVRSIRCNKLKISPEALKRRLEEKGWKISQPFKKNPEIMIVESELLPGELGRAIEHLLGYYYMQEIASMLPVIALAPKENEFILDLCAAPGSKTTQIASEMNNTGTIIANEISLDRLRILGSNLERCGVTNTIMTKKDGIALCDRFREDNILFDKILVDAPCSGEGTIRSTPKTYEMWNIKVVSSLAGLQKRLFERAFEILKIGGEMIYSTCTHSPEEDEEIVDYMLKKFKGRIQIEKISLPIKPREGITKWSTPKAPGRVGGEEPLEKEYLDDVRLSCRVYPQDNNTEGFFLAKFRRVK